MFTGIIEELGTFLSLTNSSIKIGCKKILDDIKIGDSISTNGICLTVTAFDNSSFSADVMPETFRKTSLENINCGDFINLERALKLNDRFGGHIVSGHIDGIGQIKSTKSEGNAIIVNVSTEKHLLKFIAPKGSVALDGMSLTVVNVNDSNFSVSLIPHTRDVTNFKSKKIGSIVNIETDVLAKYLDRLINFKSSSISKEFLMKEGFIS